VAFDDQFLCEIRLMSFNFAPRGWAMCNGQLLPIAQNQALFSLLGTTFGGNGQTTFGLPDLRGRVPIHVGSGHPLGERGGEQAHALTVAELPQHVHLMNGSATNADVVAPADNVVAQSSQFYGPPAQLTTLDPSSNGSTGGSQAHPNMQPYLPLTFCIALEGIFPSPN
jgi:microcystin-dependent protein